MDKAEREKRWANAAIIGELDAIAGLATETNIYKPNNPYWRSLFRLAGVCKAGYIAKAEMLDRIICSSRNLDLTVKEIAYQWDRAYVRANARYPNF